MPRPSLPLRIFALLALLGLLPSVGHAGALQHAEARLRQLGTTRKVSSRAARHVALGMPSPATHDQDNDYLLVRNGYVLSYNAGRNAMNWISWTVQASDLGPAERHDPFRPDPTLPARFYRPNNGDYKVPGYSRGHMVRSGERTATQRENDKTFVFTNMLPQAVNNNAGPWNAFENFYRDEVTQKGMVAHVIAGGVFGAPPVKPRGVAIPSATWKVVALLRRGQTVDQIDESTRVVSILVPNENDTVKVEQGWDRYRTSVGEIERQTGLHLLDELPAKLADLIKRRVDAGPVPPPAPRDFVAYNYGEGPGRRLQKLVATHVRGRVKWYDAQKGFGFIRAENGKELFVHASGRKTELLPGLDVTFDIGLGTDGREFALEVVSRAAPPPRRLVMRRTGTVSWYDDQKKYGFIRGADGKDVFVHISGVTGALKTTIARDLPVSFDVEIRDGRARAVDVTPR